jgi:hypothetical protein
MTIAYVNSGLIVYSSFDIGKKRGKSPFNTYTAVIAA